MTLHIIFGSFPYGTSLMFFLPFVLFSLMFILSFAFPSWLYKLTMAGSMTPMPCALSSLTWVFSFVCLAHILLNRMGRPNACFARLTTACVLCFFTVLHL